MSALIGILSFIPLFLACASAYYCGVYLEKRCDIHKAFVVGVVSIAFGIFVWRMPVQYILPAIGVAIGLDKIPYTP